MGGPDIENFLSLPSDSVVKGAQGSDSARVQFNDARGQIGVERHSITLRPKPNKNHSQGGMDVRFRESGWSEQLLFLMTCSAFSPMGPGVTIADPIDPFHHWKKHGTHCDFLTH